MAEPKTDIKPDKKAEKPADAKPEKAVAAAAPPPPEDHPLPPHFLRRGQSHFFAEISRISGILLVGIMLMTTFLLTAGLQHPHLGFVIFLYLSLATLGLNLVLYGVRVMLHSLGVLDRVPSLRYIQHAIFILSIIAVVGFVVTVTLLFFNVAAANPATAQPTGA